MEVIKIEGINKKCDNSERILSIKINIDDNRFALINIYNANNEPDQVKTLTECVYPSSHSFFHSKI